MYSLLCTLNCPYKSCITVALTWYWVVWRIPGWFQCNIHRHFGHEWNFILIPQPSAVGATCPYRSDNLNIADYRQLSRGVRITLGCHRCDELSDFQVFSDEGQANGINVNCIDRWCICTEYTKGIAEKERWQQHRRELDVTYPARTICIGTTSRAQANCWVLRAWIWVPTASKPDIGTYLGPPVPYRVFKPPAQLGIWTMVHVNTHRRQVRYPFRYMQLLHSLQQGCVE